MGGLAPNPLPELLTLLTDEHGEDAVRRALALVPLLANVREDSDAYLSMAVSSAAIPVGGSLVLQLPRKPSGATEVIYVGGRATLTVSP